MTVLTLIAVAGAAAVGGAINAVAGGGTLVTFPTIVWLGVPPLVANATSTVALWPGSLGGMWGYRAELGGARRWATRFAVPSVAGGACGALLLLTTPAHAFDRVVPFLVLGATLLFMGQQWFSFGTPRTIARRSAGSAPSPDSASSPSSSGGNGSAGSLGLPPARYLAVQFAVAVYGGYFGAGIGILMLATLGAMGLTNIHQMNGLKNWGAICINAVAAGIFAVSGIVDWRVALAMVLGGLLGGYGGATLAQRVGASWVRRAVVGIGLLSFAWLLLRAR